MEIKITQYLEKGSDAYNLFSWRLTTEEPPTGCVDTRRHLFKVPNHKGFVYVVRAAKQGYKRLSWEITVWGSEEESLKVVRKIENQFDIVIVTPLKIKS